ncbi:MAG: creatininase family protein [Pseudomonadota bacterium]
MTWPEVGAYIAAGGGVILPTGSVEQHGPIGLIGTDAICAEAVAVEAARRMGVVVAPPLAYAPAPFNTGFPGTVSLSEGLFEAMAHEVIGGLAAQGFRRVYVLNGHGANVAPLRAVAEEAPCPVRVESWWGLGPVATLRAELYGHWEGMHATPSEVAVTQAVTGIVHRAAGTAAEAPPDKLSPDFIAAHAGDRHGPPDAHRAAFPDGRVGSHSALASPEDGRRLFDCAVNALVEDYGAFEGAC